MKGPNETIPDVEASVAAVRTGEPSLTGGKALLRRSEFLAKRGLREAARELALDPDAPGERAQPSRTPSAGPSRPGVSTGQTGAASAYLIASAQKEEMAAAAPETGITWRPLGPAGIPR